MKKGNDFRIDQIDSIKVYAKVLLFKRLVLLQLLICIFFVACKTVKPDAGAVDFMTPNIDILEGADFCELKKFQGTGVHNKFYLSWLVVSNSSNYFFVIEASKTGKKYNPCYYVEGSVSPANHVKLLFCYTDSLSHSEKMFYRIKAIPFNKVIAAKKETKSSTLQYIPTIMIKRNCKSLQYNLLNEDN